MSRSTPATLALTLATALGGALSAPAHAGEFVVPTGYNFESVPLGGAVVGFLDDGRTLLVAGDFGTNELLVRETDGSVRLYATNIGSLAGVAQSPVTGQVVIGDSLLLPALRILEDLNNDGDCLDAGEDVPHPAQPTPLSNGEAPVPFDLAFRPGTDELYMKGSTFTTPTLGVVNKVVGNTTTLWADGLAFPGSMVWEGDTLYTADLSESFVGRVITLRDENADGDALDGGELVEFAGGLSGAGGLARAADGSFYLGGVFDTLVGGDFSGCVARLLPDDDGDGVTDGYTECFADGFAFAGSLFLDEEVGTGFVPGVGGSGKLYVGDFTYPHGNRVIRPAPRATASFDGVVGNNQTFDVVVGGRPGGVAFFLASFDTSGGTVGGIGDLCIGLVNPYVSGLRTLGPGGEARWTIVLHDQPGLVGLELGVQGVVLRAGDYGLAAPLDTVVAP